MRNANPLPFFRALAPILWGASLVLCPSSRAAVPAWVEKSNQNTQLLLDVTSRFQPEGATFQGLEGYDDKVSDFLPGNDERFKAALVGVRGELQKRLGSEADPAVRQDLEILIKSASNQLATEELTYRLTLNYTDVGQLIFYGEFGLLQEQTAASKRPSAVVRLRGTPVLSRVTLRSRSSQKPGTWRLPPILPGSGPTGMRSSSISPILAAIPTAFASSS